MKVNMLEVSNVSELKAALENIIEKQLKDASMRRADPAYWQGTSKMVTAAAWSAKNAMARSTDEAIARNSLLPIAQELRKAYHQFNDFFENDDGSGAGTFADIIRDVESIAIRGGELQPD